MLEFNPVQKNSDEFLKGFGLSLTLHFLVLAFFIIKMTYFSKPLIDLSQSITVSLSDFTETSRLPEKVVNPKEDDTPPSRNIEKEISEAETVKPKNIPKEVVKKNLPNEKEIEINLKKVKSKQKDALSKLKKMAAMEKINQAIKKDAIAKIKSRTAAEAKPRVVPAGAALGGLDKLQAGQYLQLIDQSIKQHWLLPQWLINKPLQAKVLVKFTKDGEIISSQILSSSGNNSYDQYCLQAIDKAMPFPKVPDKFSEKFSVDGVVIGFPE